MFSWMLCAVARQKTTLARIRYEKKEKNFLVDYCGWPPSMESDQFNLLICICLQFSKLQSVAKIIEKGTS
jgi:hypothetical protein